MNGMENVDIHCLLEPSIHVVVTGGTKLSWRLYGLLGVLQLRYKRSRDEVGLGGVTALLFYVSPAVLYSTTKARHRCTAALSLVLQPGLLHDRP